MTHHLDSGLFINIASVVIENIFKKKKSFINVENLLS